ncbi:uncharacterized mitochondrial protein AtMg00310-like [Brassica napus]|uniref:uncharacterized mitochondrial protein AtMg00310-like n=1 Tax=Brassica napus TaxID=3708 RepID=UPI002079A3E3|nr:uncharacterized mitochondrial protein AtMg00310-like [Brassica napus]
MVLLKAVLSAMPSYTMTCFKLPKSLCKQIQSILTRFWWDLKPNIRKMCWVAWDNLTLPKNAGGLGVREIEVFNDALLAKIPWRLLRNPNSLLGQVLLNKYCKYENLLECLAPGNASHGWRGILAGREIIKRGVGWIVGDGRNIKVWEDNWLSTTEQRCPMGPAPENLQGLRVSDLISPLSAEWNSR